MIAARPMIARSDAATVAAIVDVLDGAPPIGLIPERATAAEQAALAARLAAAPVPDDTACVVFTSGSTGRPKGVVLSRAAIAAATAASAAHLGASDDDRWLLALPLGHVAGVAVVARAHRGGRVPRLGTAHDLAAPEVTHASLVPTQLDQVLADPTWRPSPRLRVVLVGGAAAPPALLAAARARGVPVRTTYGMTETFGQIATADADAPEPDGAVGRLLPGVAVVAGTATAPAPLVVRAPGLFTGYLDDPTPLGPAGFPTRDLGYLRGDRLVVCGRADDVIITGGENVYPTEIEGGAGRGPGGARRRRGRRARSALGRAGRGRGRRRGGRHRRAPRGRHRRLASPPPAATAGHRRRAAGPAVGQARSPGAGRLLARARAGLVGPDAEGRSVSTAEADRPAAAVERAHRPPPDHLDAMTAAARHHRRDDQLAGRRHRDHDLDVVIDHRHAHGVAARPVDREPVAAVGQRAGQGRRQVARAVGRPAIFADHRHHHGHRRRRRRLGHRQADGQGHGRDHHQDALHGSTVPRPRPGIASAPT
jgi:hypothetical protein